jgi:uncharacterized membrane protein YjgN (DUF898 family)
MSVESANPAIGADEIIRFIQIQVSITQALRSLEDIMNGTLYHVVYKGEILSGFDMESVCQNLARISSISAEKARRILEGGRVILKRNLDETAARRFGARLQKMGLKVALQLTGAKASTSLPGALRTGEKPRAERPIPPAEARAEKVTTAADVLKASVRSQGRSLEFEFRGNGTEYFRIWIVNILLSVLTLGIYSAWAKVRRNQYFYGNTRLDEASFEYLADPKKILKGRMIAGGIILIVNLLSRMNSTLSMLLAPVFVFGFPWVINRTLAFQAYNSAYRNIRFGFKATYGQALKTFVLWPMAVLPTLGLLLPHVYRLQKRFLVENSRYGKTHFTFHATSWEYFRIFLVSGLFLTVCAGLIGMAIAFHMPKPIFILILPLYLFMFAYLSVSSTNLFFSSTRLGSHRFQGMLKTKDYLVLVLTNTLAMALTLGLFTPWAKVRTMRYKIQHLILKSSGDLNTFVADKQKEVGAFGEEMGGFMDFDFGL